MENALVSILFLAALNEGMVEYIFAQYETMKPYLKYVALAGGILIAVFYNIDIPAMLGITSKYTLVNQILSGLMLGRGSNYVNDAISGIRGLAKPEVQ